MRTPLRHLADVRVSNVDKKAVEGELPVRLCNYTDVYYQDVIDPATNFMAATATPAQIHDYALQPGDTLLTKDSETADDIAVPAYVADAMPGVVSGYHLALVRPDPVKIDPRFLFRALQSDFMREQFSTLATGVTRFGLTYGALRGAEVPIAAEDVTEQRRIADFLDDEVSRLDRMLRLTREQAVLVDQHEQSWVDHVTDDMRDRAPLVPLGRWIEDIEQGWSPQASESAALGRESGVLKLGAVREGRFRPGENKAFTEGSQPMLRYEVRAGDLLASRANTRQLVGEAAVVPEGTRRGLFLSDLLYRISLSSIKPGYVSLVLRSSRIRGLLGTIARGTSESMAKLRGDDFRGLMVPAAGQAKQQQLAASFARLLVETDRLRAGQRERLSLLQERKRALITAAVTGEFDVTTASGRGVA